MAKQKTSRKELLKGPDEFVTFSAGAAEFIRTHQQQLRYIGYVVLAIVVAYFALHIWMGHVNKMGQMAYNAAEEDMRAWMMKSDPDPEAMKKSGELFSEVIENHGMSNAAPLASALAAHVKVLEKDYPQAIVLYKNFLDEFSGDTQYETLGRLALTSCYEASGDLKTALETLSPMVGKTVDSPFREMAMWHLARLYRLNNQPEKELEMLKEFTEQYTNSPFHTMAKARL